jgi:hypothetical protein
MTKYDEAYHKAEMDRFTKKTQKEVSPIAIPNGPLEPASQFYDVRKPVENICIDSVGTSVPKSFKDQVARAFGSPVEIPESDEAVSYTARMNELNKEIEKADKFKTKVIAKIEDIDTKLQVIMGIEKGQKGYTGIEVERLIDDLHVGIAAFKSVAADYSNSVRCIHRLRGK